MDGAAQKATGLAGGVLSKTAPTNTEGGRSTDGGDPVSGLLGGLPVKGLPTDGLPVDSLPTEGLPLSGLPTHELPISGLPGLGAS